MLFDELALRLMYPSSLHAGYFPLRFEAFMSRSRDRRNEKRRRDAKAERVSTDRDEARASTDPSEVFATDERDQTPFPPTLPRPISDSFIESEQTNPGDLDGSSDPEIAAAAEDSLGFREFFSAGETLDARPDSEARPDSVDENDVLSTSSASLETSTDIDPDDSMDSEDFLGASSSAVAPIDSEVSDDKEDTGKSRLPSLPEPKPQSMRPSGDSGNALLPPPIPSIPVRRASSADIDFDDLLDDGGAVFGPTETVFVRRPTVILDSAAKRLSAIAVAGFLGLLLGFLFLDDDDTKTAEIEKDEAAEVVVASAEEKAAEAPEEVVEVEEEGKAQEDVEKIVEEEKPSVTVEEVLIDKDGTETVVAAAPVVEEKPVTGSQKVVAPCRIWVVSKPARARLSINGQRVGKTPYKGPAPCGKTKLNLRLAKHEAKSKTVKIGRKKTRKVNVQLDRPSVKIRITSSPKRATIRVNGKKVGKTPMLASVPAGKKAKIVVSKPGFKKWTKTVVPKKPKKIAVKAKLKKQKRTSSR